MIDPATPFWLGAAALKYLPNGRQVLIPNAGHGVGNACIDSIVAEFFEEASAKKLATDCVKEIKRPPFVFGTN
jgi:TAP-like protein